MGVFCFQERSREEPSSRTIRVVHIDGLIEDFESPTTVNEIIGYFTRHFLTTPIQILQVGLVPLKNDARLEPGRIYFLLPYAITRFNESSVDLLPLTKKLIKIAKTRRSIAKPAPRLPSSVIPQNIEKEPSQIIPPPVVAKVAKTTNSKAKPPRALKKKSLTKKLSNIAKSHGVNDPPASQGSNDSSNADQNNNVVVRRNRMMSWKPLLSTIREISFNRRESDLRD